MMEMECSRFLVQKTCPKYGSSPINYGQDNPIFSHLKIIKCRIIGGFGKQPVDESILSEESKKLIKTNGPCLTIAEVPSVDEQGYVKWEVTKIFSPPCLSDREKNVPMTSSDLATKSFK
jgi:hypothetical protein